MNKKRMNLALGEDIAKWLDERAKDLRISRTALINIALEQYMHGVKLMKDDKGISELVDKLQDLSKSIKSGKVMLVEKEK